MNWGTPRYLVFQYPNSPHWCFIAWRFRLYFVPAKVCTVRITRRATRHAKVPSRELLTKPVESVRLVSTRQGPQAFRPQHHPGWACNSTRGLREKILNHKSQESVGWIRSGGPVPLLTHGFSLHHVLRAKSRMRPSTSSVNPS